MRTLTLTSLVLFCGGVLTLAQEGAGPTALQAIKLLPKGAAKSVARIEARDGKPNPGRWNILVHDAKEETGVHEYVVAGDEIVASRSVSQFAETLKSEDVVGVEAIKLDSDRVSAVVQQYVLANNAAVASMNYQLLREGEGAAPIWKVTCLDEAGQSVGSVVMTASKGTVVSHEGFPIEPVASKEKLAVHASDEIDAPAANGTGKSSEKAAATSTGTRTTSTKKTTASRSTARTEDDDAGPRRGEKGFFHRAGGKLQKFFTGRDTLSR